VYESMTLNEIGARKRERKPFYFERLMGSTGWSRMILGCAGCNRPAGESNGMVTEIPEPRAYR